MCTLSFQVRYFMEQPRPVWSSRGRSDVAWPERCGVPGAKSTLFLSALQGTRILQLPVGQTQCLPAPGWRV